MEFAGTFNCNGKVNSNDWMLSRSSTFLQDEIESVIFASQEASCFLGDVIIFNKIVPSAVAALNLKHLTTCTEMKLKLLSRRRNQEIFARRNETIDQPDFFLARKNVCECLVYIRSYFYSIKWDPNLINNVNRLIGEDFEDLLLVVQKYLKGLKSVNDSVFHYAASNLGNKCVQPDFHMYHLHLELRWLNVTLLHAKECPESYSSQIELLQDSISSSGNINVPFQSAELDFAIAGVVEDLVYIAIKLFERIPLADLRLKTPYSCTCARELWLMLQIFIDDLAAKRKSKTFWQYVNISLDTKIGESKPETSTSWTEKAESHSFSCKNPEMFCIWLIYHLALLYGYNLSGVYAGVASARIQPNYVQVEKILKVYVNKGGKAGERDEIDEELGGMIPLLTTLTCEWWKPRVQIVSLLWDCFHRRLDQPFLLQAAGPWLVSIDKKGPADILKQVKQRLEDNLEQTKLSSYGMFLRLLGLFLRKSMLEHDSKYWNQIKGRIYSKFTKSKVEEFSEAGLYNFISLFITLALVTNTSEVCTVMLDLLPSILTDNKEQRSRIIVWKGELTVFLLFAEQKISFAKVSERFFQEVDAISCRKDETSRSMLASYVDVLDEMLMSSEKMELSEHSFIGGWIDRYFLECPKNKVKALITVLNNVFNKCVQLRNSNGEINPAAYGCRLMLEALWKHVAGRVRMLVMDTQIYGDHYQTLTELAVRFTLEALREPGMAAHYHQKFVSLFKHFSSSPMIKDVRIIRSYLTLILRNEKAVQELKKELRNFDSIVIQAWIKCCIMKSDAVNTEIKYLTRYVISSDEIAQTFQSNSDLIAMENSKEPILVFIRAIMKRRDNLQTEQQRISLGAKCREYFMHIEKWAMVPITEETKDSELTYWIYRCIGTLIFCCSPMLHVKTQPNSMLLILINKFMLPSEKTAYIMNIGRRIFSMIISGIGNLDVRGDLSLQLLIKNLFENYLPQLITDTSKTGSCKISDTLLKCFCDDNVNFLKLIFEKLTVNFVTCRDGMTHKHCYLVIFLLRNLVNNGKSYGPHITDMIISICLPHIIICYMKVHDFHAHKQQTIDLISDLTLSPYYKEDQKRREEIAATVLNMVQKYLSTASKTLFEFMTSVCRIIPELMGSLSSKIDKTISELENNKYPNIAALRFSLNQLQKSVQPSGRR